MNKLIIGCNYHTTWQSAKSMRFVLLEVKGTQALLATRTTGNLFWTNADSLIFVDTSVNRTKAKDLLNGSLVFNSTTLRYN